MKCPASGCSIGWIIMQENVNPYVWQPLNLKELPQTKQCKMCGQDHHLLALNEHIVFWIHQGKETEKCTCIAFKTSYLNGLKTILEEKKQKLNSQVNQK